MTATTGTPDLTPPSILRVLRASAGMGLRQLAETTGINRGRLSVIERGVTPTHDEAERIATAVAEAFRVQAAVGFVRTALEDVT